MSSEIAASVIDLYERHSAAYDRLRSRNLMERDWLDRFAALLPAGGTVLDLGCGMGEPIARYLADRGFGITGIDTSSALIALAESRQPGQRWIVGDIRALAIGSTFDGVLAWDSFFHLQSGEQQAMFDVFHRHTTPGSALMFTSGPAHGEAIGDFEGEPLYHASLDPDAYRQLLSKFGFSVEAYVPEDASCGGHTIWLARRI